MKKETRNILIGAAAVVLLYFLFRKKKPTDTFVDAEIIDDTPTDIETGVGEGSDTGTGTGTTTGPDDGFGSIKDPVDLSIELKESTKTEIDLDDKNSFKDSNFSNASGTYTYELVGNPTKGGTASLSGSTLTYTPAPDYVGNDMVSYRIVDSDGATSNTAIITFTMTPVYDGPQPKNLTQTVQEDGSVTLSLVPDGTSTTSGDGFGQDNTITPDNSFSDKGNSKG